MTSFDSLLIANRGEIVVRIARTAKAMGIRTVAVYSDADRDAPHVHACDDAIHIGATPASESYLSIEAILDAARRSGAQAIHPGYGFLSERAEFARAVVDAGLVFVGPSGAVMDAMGRKDHAREIAVAAGVPVVPGIDPDSVDASEFPVLVKAAAGGGGKGMRVVREPADLAAAIAAARREAASSFGDDTILVERYVDHGRHVEVQVLADEHGNVLHFFERDCSAQRRHQKVLEEAPAPNLSADVRALLLDSAVALARQVGYTNAGTVEFLVDPDRGTDGVYFLEMNTRLQVEHPVTELITGRDLVELQLRIAAGEPLGLSQDDISCTGHALEARVYAEDAFGGFLPQAGRASVVHWSPLARNDQALEPGQVVTSSYDPMLGKVIVHAADRDAARARLVAALADTTVLGLTTNIGFVRQLAASEAFATGAVDTSWLDQHAGTITPPDAPLAAVFAAAAVAEVGVRREAGDPFGAGDGWRSAGPSAPVRVELLRDGVTTHWRLGEGRALGPDGDLAVRVLRAEGDRLTLEVDGERRTALVDVRPDRVEVSRHGSTYAFARPQGPAAAGDAVSDGTLVAQMPGTLLAVETAEGQRVVEGQVLGVLEAMKMELAVKAPFAGTVGPVPHAAGDQVAMGAVLFTVSPEQGEDD